MRDYPNMSYCMVENTSLAMEQIIDAMSQEGSGEFYAKLSRSEKKAFARLLDFVETFREEAEQVLNEG